MGASGALSLILTGDPLSPQAAAAAGLVDRLTQPGNAAKEARELVKRIADQAGRRGISTTKTALYSGLEIPLASALTLDRAVHWESVRRGDFASTVTEFLAKYGG
jgi:enoyl-CoA hydratase/carnithine racemase